MTLFHFMAYIGLNCINHVWDLRRSLLSVNYHHHYSLLHIHDENVQATTFVSWEHQHHHNRVEYINVLKGFEIIMTIKLKL